MRVDVPPEHAETMSQAKLGTFLGVFTPTILTILGVIMYLRFGWLVGHLGVMRVLGLVVIANIITLVTSLSFSSVATNSRVGVGGAYYIISRSLGIEIGGAIGVPLYLSQVLSVTLYAFGLAESFRIVQPDLNLIIATLFIIVVVSVLALFGADYALKVQIPLMFLVGLSLVFLTVGALGRSSGVMVDYTTTSGELPFWMGFAILFPAVTGVMAGLGLSGDLKNPNRSIPLGSISAALVGLAVYMVVPLLLAWGAPVQQLKEDPLVWTKIAPYGKWVILPGLWSAIFSSAVGSILAAPRTLQALSRDGLVFSFLGRRTGDRWELFPGLTLSMCLAMGAVFIGNLNDVATVVTMFFLTVYGMVNLVAAFETLAGDTSWRPTLRIPWVISFLGGAACIAAMILINVTAGVIALIAEFSLWFFLSRKERTANWGDARRGLYESLIRWALIKLARRPMSARNWRPHLMVFVSGAIRELDLVRFADWFSQGRGIVTVCELIVGDLLSADEGLVQKQFSMQQTLAKENLVVFAEVDIVEDIVEGIVNVAQANGMAGIASNTVMLGWPKEPSLQVQFLKVMRKLEKLNKSLIIGRFSPRHLYPREGIAREIHVWWGGLQNNGDLMLLLAYLLTRNAFWRDATVKVMSIARDDEEKKHTESHLMEFMHQIRIKAVPRVTIKPSDMEIHQLIQRESEQAEVVFMGLATPAEGEEQRYSQRLETLAGELSTVFFVKNASLFMGTLLDADPES